MPSLGAVLQEERRVSEFFSNPAVEGPIINLPDLNSSTYMNSSNKFFLQRTYYPSSIANSNPEGYEEAKIALGGLMLSLHRCGGRRNKVNEFVANNQPVMDKGCFAPLR